MGTGNFLLVHRDACPKMILTRLSQQVEESGLTVDFFNNFSYLGLHGTLFFLTYLKASVSSMHFIAWYLMISLIFFCSMG